MASARLSSGSVDEPFRPLFGRSGAVLDIARIEMLGTWKNRHLGYLALAELVQAYLAGGYQLGCCSVELPAEGATAKLGVDDSRLG